MAVSLSRFSCWLWAAKEDPVPNGSSLNSNSECVFGLRDPDNLKFPTVKGTKLTSSSRKIKRKWQSREERRIDKEYDVVLVPSDGVCLSVSESDDSDWSVGWLEPHGSGFNSEDESDNNGFAVLVPCYSPSCKEVAQGSHDELLSDIKNEFLPEGYSFMEQWLSSIQNFEA